MSAYLDLPSGNLQGLTAEQITTLERGLLQLLASSVGGSAGATAHAAGNIFGLPPGTILKILGPILLQILQGLLAGGLGGIGGTPAPGTVAHN